MVNYGQKKEYIVQIHRVDYFPEIAGVKLSSVPMIGALSIIPLWFNSFGLSVFVLFALLLLCYRAGRLEDDGNPVFINAHLIALSKLLPRTVRSSLLPSFAHIKSHKKSFRR